MTSADIVKAMQILGLRNIVVKGKWVMGSCPVASIFHEKKSDNRPSFGISTNNPSGYNCFACGHKGKLWEIPPLLSTVYKPEIVSKFMEHLTIKESFTPVSKPVEVKTCIAMDDSKLNTCSKPKKSYFKIPITSYEEWEIYQVNHYLLFPIRDRFGRLVDMKVRDIEQPKYFVSPSSDFLPKFARPESSPSAKTGGIWYGEHIVKDKSKALLVVEGERDAILASHAGVKNVVASMGASVTEQQLLRLPQLGFKELVVIMDDDAAGKKAQQGVIESCKMYCDIFVLKNYNGCKDVAQLVEEGKFNTTVSQTIKVT